MFWGLISREESTFYKCEEDYILYRKLKNIASDTFKILCLDSKAILVLSTSLQELVPF